MAVHDDHVIDAAAKWLQRSLGDSAPRWGMCRLIADGMLHQAEAAEEHGPDAPKVKKAIHVQRAPI